MDEKTLAQFGLFTITVIGYALGTGLIGVIVGIDSNGDDRLFPYVAWITGAIAYGMLVAEAMGKPFVYVRPKPKDHGTGSQIEGDLPKGAKVVVVEDLISTGGSSLSAVDCLQKSGAVVLGMVAIFTYNFIRARRAFEYANVELHTLSHYEALLEEAVAENYIKQEDMEVLKQWRINPENWGK